MPGNIHICADCMQKTFDTMGQMPGIPGLGDINIGDMLENGTVMNGKLIESPKSFQVACTVMTQIISAVASSQYGGQSVDIRHLGKYLHRSHEKYMKKYREKYTGVLSEELMEQLADDRLQDEPRSGVQTIQYQINTLMTTNGQSPFVTLFLNPDKSHPYAKENAMIIQEILRQRIEGIKNEAGVYVTPAFPKLVYVLNEDNNLSGGVYDDLTRLAVKCSAKRMYPDYISAKKMKENYEGNVFSPMGCRSFLSPWKDENGNYKWEAVSTKAWSVLIFRRSGFWQKEIWKDSGRFSTRDCPFALRH